ncbi:unnamed protein product [Calypogeia fissa]
MSRSGTLQDALRFVDEFQRAPLPSSSRLKELPSLTSAHGGHEEEDAIVKQQDRGRRSKRRDGREKSEKDARRKSKKDTKDRAHKTSNSGRQRKRRKHSVKGEEYDQYDDDDDDDEEAESDESADDDDDDNEEEEDSSDDDDERRRRKKEKRRAERKKKESREHRRRKDGKSSSRRAGRRRSEKERDREREERKRERRRRRHRSGRLRSSEDDSSASEDENSGSGSESAESQGRDSALRSAEQVAAGIVEEFPEVENDLQQLLQTVDSGQAVDISGLPNRRLVALLQELFRSLSLKKTTTGVYLLPSGSQPILERLSWSSISRNQTKVGQSGAAGEPGSELPASVGKEDSHTNKSHSKLEATTGPLPRAHENSDAQKRRVIGPAMPSAEMLEAAAKLTEAEEALRDAEAALENDPLIGPPPPAAVAEAASANDAERFEEVTRITAADVGDAYDLLGLKQGVSAGDLKKRYWKLSLLVHPDKCQHPLAHQAFMALNKAFKDLQDPLKRSEIDRKADEKLAKEEYEAERRAELQAAQWRKLRGEEALPGDAELLRGDVKDPGRDEWMTKLPPERQAGGPPSQQNTFFSRTEKKGRGDTSAWTDTPLEKAQKAKMQYLEAYKLAALTGPENTESVFEKEKAAKTAAVLDDYNQKKRSLSLLEEHQQKSKKGLKKAKNEKNQSQEDKKKEWAESHPWKPWDREKDLTAGRQAMKWDDKKNVGDSLSSRFGSSDRTFL